MAGQSMSFAVILLILTINCVLCSYSIDISRRRTPSKFKVYWNVPSIQCAGHKINFTEINEKFGIIQNDNDSFRGNKVVIMYDPGYFPALLEQKGSNRFFYRNGGVPQEGDLTLHMEYFKKHVNEQIPDINFNGVGVIDFESWRPIYRQNFGSLIPYKEYSINLERQRHPLWSESLIKKEATRRFEKSGRIFMEQTLIYIKQLRPNATWGYYAYPYCFNMREPKVRDCSAEVKKENDRLSWLFDISDAYYPSLYMPKDGLTPKEKILMIEGRILEAERIARETNNILKVPKIIPYFWYRYQDVDEYLTKEDMYNSLLTLKSMGTDGILLWGSSNDVNSKQRCLNLKNYIENVLGPILLSI